MTRSNMKIEKADKIGLCFGIRRAISIIEKVVGERGSVETLGAIAHNQHVVQSLEEKGVRVAESVDDVKGDTVVIASHGVSPQVLEELQARHLNIVDTTCPFVHRPQIAARRLAGSGFLVAIYGDASHAEVKGILGWANGKGIATLDAESITGLDPLPRRVGILSQTTQIPANFTEFAKRLIDATLTRDSELRIIDTICHDTRERQAATVKLAGEVDLMLIIGSRGSANTNRLVELCYGITEVCFVESAREIKSSQLRGKRHIGITAGASTPEQTIDEVISKLKTMSKGDIA